MIFPDGPFAITGLVTHGGCLKLLSRTLTRQGAQATKRQWRPPLRALLALGAVALLFLLLPKPGPRIRSVAMSDEELRPLTNDLRGPPRPLGDKAPRALVALGRELFHDSGLGSPAGLSCAGCHESAAKAQGSTETPPVPQPLANLRFATWFGADGHADSLAAAVLASCEDPTQLASSRLAIAKRVASHWGEAYMAAFGDEGDLELAQRGPSEGLPSPPPLHLSVAVAAAGLGTLGDRPRLGALLQAANRQHLAPAVEFSRLAFAATPPPPAWLSNYNSLTTQERASASRIFANVGLAIAAYVGGLVALDSPFDRFAARFADGRAAPAAFGPGFGADELTGLKLAAGPGGCLRCHRGVDFSDHEFHNLGLSQKPGPLLAGRAVGALKAQADPFNCLNPIWQNRYDCAQLTTLNPDRPAWLGAFQTRSLRNVGQRTRFMHDGHFTSLAEVLRFYNELEVRPAVGERDATLQPLGFTPEELKAVGSFLQSLEAPVVDLHKEESVSGG